MSLPGASELFRPTHAGAVETDEPGPVGLTAVAPIAESPSPLADQSSADPTAPAAPTTLETKPGQGTGRVRHDEKITVYVSSDELLSLERARLELRASHGLAVDRGRIVREAIAAILADFETQADASQLVRRLS